MLSCHAVKCLKTLVPGTSALLFRVAPGRRSSSKPLFCLEFRRALEIIKPMSHGLEEAMPQWSVCINASTPRELRGPRKTSARRRTARGQRVPTGAPWGPRSELRQFRSGKTWREGTASSAGRRGRPGPREALMVKSRPLNAAAVKGHERPGLQTVQHEVSKKGPSNTDSKAVP